MTSRAIAALALSAALIAIFTAPGVTIGAGLLSDTTSAVQQTAAQATAPVQQAIAPVQETVASVAPAPASSQPAPAAPVQQVAQRVTEPVRETVERVAEPVREAVPAAPVQTRQEAQDPATEPAVHGTNPHGQGTVGVVDVNPSPERPQSGDTDGSESGEEVVVGRARGEQQEDGDYHGRITIAALFGNEILGVETDEGEERSGPLDPLQQAVLDPICDGSGEQVCLEVLAADSATSETGSANRFAIASARLGGAEGLSAGAGESSGTVQEDGGCQTATGSSRVANVSAGGQAVANVAESESTTRACRGQDPQTTQSSQVIGLGGSGVPIPAAGCADGTPDTVTGIPTLAPIVCNASEQVAGGGVRHALDVFVLQVGGTSLVQVSAAQAESVAKAPPADDGDPGDDGTPATPSGGDPTPTTPSTGSGDGDGGGGDGPTGPSGDPDDGGDDGPGGPGDGDDGGPGGPGDGETECSDGIDNDGDGRIDLADPDCDSVADDSESPATLRSGLPFTGADAVSLALAGLLVLAGGLLLRRRTTATG